VDPHHLHEDPETDPYPDFNFDADADLDPTFHTDADPEPDTAPQ
jgi:hypothetical protein